ncbi:hypothetical protein QQF64_011287 [Cirrhinus molitorella]|uniref:Uncharacterized protein n=1 Tax=Cirrhinus molitorella TaxID=172907 RepID=A0ABR3LYT5_9TELE
MVRWSVESDRVLTTNEPLRLKAYGGHLFKEVSVRLFGPLLMRPECDCCIVTFTNEPHHEDKQTVVQFKELNKAERPSSINSGNPTAAPKYWNFSWIAEDELTFPEDPVSTSDCSSKGKSCDRRPAGYYPEFAWSLTSAEDSWAKDQTMAKTKASFQGWEEGKAELRGKGVSFGEVTVMRRTQVQHDIAMGATKMKDARPLDLLSPMDSPTFTAPSTT